VRGADHEIWYVLSGRRRVGSGPWKGLWGLDRDRYANTIEELREQAIVADETGWTSMMFAEHHFEIEGYHVTPNPLLLNVYLAQHTKRLRRPNGSGAAELIRCGSPKISQ
jgi:hypothetical protein